MITQTNHAKFGKLSKAWLGIVFAAVLFAAFWLFAPKAGAVSDLLNGVVTATSLNLREQPSTDAKSLALIPNGNVVLVVSVDENEGWSCVYYGSQSGYVKSEFISLVPIIQFASDVSLKVGDTNELVKQVQQALSVCGYDIAVDGYFGPATETVVKAFQRDAGLTVDGVLGQQCMDKLYEMQLLAFNRSLETKTVEAVAVPKGTQIEMLNWFTEGTKAFALGDVATCIDVYTGITFQVQRRGGTNHADVQPLTKEDTASMLKARDGSWSWSRRPMIVLVNGRALAASWNGMPHGEGAIKNNNFNGHFCIHMLGSKTHGSNKVDAEHQAMVKEAYAVGVL